MRVAKLRVFPRLLARIRAQTSPEAAARVKAERKAQRKAARLKRRAETRNAAAAKQVRSLLAAPDELAKFEHNQITAVRTKNLVSAEQPLILISQVPRSGGTLLSQLFDMHPQCHVHPYELRTAGECKHRWPRFDLASNPTDWFDGLIDPLTLALFARGYSKTGSGSDPDERCLPFLFLPSVQKAIFQQLVAERPINTMRALFDVYMTSYFNAWVDNQNLYTEPKRNIVAFASHLASYPDEVRKYFTDYPDGRLISIVREPKSWYASARRHKPQYNPVSEGIEYWLRFAGSLNSLKRDFPDQVIVLRFDDLLGNTEALLRRLTIELGLRFVPSLLSPTFNGHPIKANTSFTAPGPGVFRDPLHRAQTLPAEDAEYIDSVTQETFEAVLELALRI